MARQDEKALKQDPNRKLQKSWWRAYEKRKRWLKSDNFECAVTLLEGRDAIAGPSAIRRSYISVERALRERTLALEAWFDDGFLRKLGIQGLLDRKPGTKTFLFLT
jgi:hypothetical protein